MALKKQKLAGFLILVTLYSCFEKAHVLGKMAQGNSEYQLLQCALLVLQERLNVWLTIGTVEAFHKSERLAAPATT